MRATAKLRQEMPAIWHNKVIHLSVLIGLWYASEVITKEQFSLMANRLYNITSLKLKQNG